MNQANILITIIQTTALSIVTALVGALVIQIATKIVAKYKPPYIMAYTASLVGFLASALLSSLLTNILVLKGNKLEDLNPLYTLIISILGFVTQITVYTYIIKNPEGKYISIKTSGLIAIIQLIVGSLLLSLLFLAMILLTKTGFISLN